MANDIDKVTIQELDVTEALADGDLLIAETGDGRVKSLTKRVLFADDRAERQLQEGALQKQINDMAGAGGEEGTYRVVEKLDKSLKGAPGGLAELDENGTVPAAQLPSYVDDVVEGYYGDGKFYENYDDDPQSSGIWTDGADFYDADTSAGEEPSGSPLPQTAIGTARRADGAFYEQATTETTHTAYSPDGNAFYGSKGEATAYSEDGQTFYSTLTPHTVYSDNGADFYTDSELTEPATIPDGITPVLSDGNEYTYYTLSDQLTLDVTPVATGNQSGDIGEYAYPSFSEEVTPSTAPTATGNAYEYAYTETFNEWHEITAFTEGGFETDADAETDASILAALELAGDLTISYVVYAEATYSGEIEPETGKVYTDLRTNVTYRWGGSSYVKIASDLALGETISTAYRGDRGKTAYDHSQARGTGTETAVNPHGLSKADIGLSEVPNVSTNDQTPTYTRPDNDAALESGETLSAAMGKLARAVDTHIAHMADTGNPHGVTKAQVGLGNVTNVATESTITSGSEKNITSGAVFDALAGKLDSDGTAKNSRYAQAIGTDQSHPQVGGPDVPVYVDAAGEPKPITALDVRTIKGDVSYTGRAAFGGNVEVGGNLDARADALFERNVTISGNLTVSGATSINESESAIADDYLVTRSGNAGGLADGTYSGLAVSNYRDGKMATITTDSGGTWRVANSATNTARVYSDLAYKDGTYYVGLTGTEAEDYPSHIITNRDSVSIDDAALHDGAFYVWKDGAWYGPLSYAGGDFDTGPEVTDSALADALDGSSRSTLTYYCSVTDNYIDSSENQPLLTRDEVSELTDGNLLIWDAANNRAVDGGDVVAALDEKIPALDSTSTILDADVIMITHEDGGTEKITGRNLLAEIDRLLAARLADVTPLNATISDLLSGGHNIPRFVDGHLGKDITAYYQDGTLWKRIEGTDGFQPFEDIYVGDYFQMSRAITAPNQDSQYATTGSQWVTIAGINTLRGNGDNISMDYNHLVMVPGKGETGDFHFGRKRMNSSNTTANGYAGSEMHTATLGGVVSAGSTASNATINQQLYAEFGSHLKTTRELLSNAMTTSLSNRFGSAGGASSNWGWYSCQACLMSEVEVYGSVVWSSSGYDTGTGCKQLPLFAFSKKAVNNRSSYYWLKDVASSAYFAFVSSIGYAYYYGASYTGVYVRPRFVLGA